MIIQTEIPYFINCLANSNEVLINHILEKAKQAIPLSFKKKVRNLESLIKKIDDFSFNKSELINSLRKLNKYWNISKHGKVIGNVPYGYLKGEVITIFTGEILKSLGNEFTENQKRLIEINNKLNSVKKVS